MKIKYRKLKSRWLRSTRNQTPMPWAPPSLARAYFALERRRGRALERRVLLIVHHQQRLLSPTPTPSISEPSIPPETSAESSSTTSSPAVAETPSSHDEIVVGHTEEFLNGLLCDRLRDMAKGHGVTGYSKMRKAELVAALMDVE